MNNLKQILEKVLKQDKIFLDVEAGEINYIKVKDLADKIDEKLISLLLGNKKLKEKFFIKIKDVYVFNIQDFKFFLDESKVDNSYTKYANKIGLADNSGLLENRSEVVLDFPFKDCVLEGGQSTEEGADTYFEYEEEKIKVVRGKEKTESSGYKERQANRKEVFFNQVLAHDEIDRLFDKKALVNWRRFAKGISKKGETVKKIKRDENGMIKENIIIKGNNLLALHSLKSEFSGKIKLIYIDPPYNRNAKTFYNDNFNHSTWLTFMKNRLEVARKLLREDGSIFISIDNNELSYLQILMDEIFGSENKQNIITIKRSSVSGAKVINTGVVNVSEFLIVYSKNKKDWSPNRVFRKKSRDKRYNTFIKNFSGNFQKWQFQTVLEAFADSLEIEKKKLKKFLGDSYEDKLDDFYMSNASRIIRFVSLDESSVSDAVVKLKRKSEKDDKRVYRHQRKDRLDYYIYKGQGILFFENRLVEIDGNKVFGELLHDIWDDVLPNDLHNEGGVSLKKGKKPEKLIQRIIDLTTSLNDIVLDYHLGSGTTAGVTHKMKRQYIGIEQLDYGNNDSMVRIANVINGESSGISKAVKWKGGGDVIYVELAKFNEKAKEEINNAKNLSELIKLFNIFYEKYFLNYNVKIKDFKEKIIKEENFKKLTLTEQKRMFLIMLDLNQMYVNESEMPDKKYGISIEDQKLTKVFYSKK